jgi:hypothetical protein
MQYKWEKAGRGLKESLSEAGRVSEKLGPRISDASSDFISLLARAWGIGSPGWRGATETRLGGGRSDPVARGPHRNVAGPRAEHPALATKRGV